MKDAFYDRAIVFLAATGLIFLAGAVLAVAVAAFLVAGDNIRHATGAAVRRTEALRHRRTARREAARTDFDTALANITKENDQ